MLRLTTSLKHILLSICFFIVGLTFFFNAALQWNARWHLHTMVRADSMENRNNLSQTLLQDSVISEAFAVENATKKMEELATAKSYLLNSFSVPLPQCHSRDTCVSSKPKKWNMFIFVKSAAANTLRRMNIRNTWGAVKYIEGGIFTTIFIVGKAEGPSQALIDEEFARFNDVLQVNEPDDYVHLVMKTLGGMRWASENLKNDDFYSSADDDMMVNLGKLQENIDKYIEEKVKNSWPEFPLICTYESWADAGKPIRTEKHKNYVSLVEYKWTEWPKFCLGGMYTASVGVIKQLYEISKTQQPLRTDDVWITGILRNILGMPTSMVVFPQPPIAQHITIDGGSATPESTTKRYRSYWRTALHTFSSKTMCIC